MKEKNKIFEDLFVLEVANNHLGQLERGKKIISEFAQVVRFNNIKAAIKLQFRDVDRFIHKDFKNFDDRYIKKTMATKLNFEEYAELIHDVKHSGCITMSTPFDEHSVQTCMDLDVDIIKVASSDLNDWVLLEAIAETRKPVIVSTGGSSLKDVDDIVHFFGKRAIPLSVNHCVSIYPSEKNELELNQIDFLKNRYPELVIGFSTHEYNEDIESTMLIAYAKGAKTFERHIDLDYDGITLSPYNSLPSDLDRWIKAWHKAKEICGAPGTQKRIPPKKEIEYLDKLVRGVYAKHDLKAGDTLTEKDVYLAIPLQKGQISCRELMNGEILKNDIKADVAIHIDNIDSIYAQDKHLKEKIYNRGISI
ncbi:MAG: N-acetylneuraminate synthase family protein [Brevinemataceae bacterium]